MAARAKRRIEQSSVPIAPMIDVVFLPLIYFMVSSTLSRQEADLSFQLPGAAEQAEPLDMPDEQIIEIRANGQVVVNEYCYDQPGDLYLAELTALLTRFRQASDANRVPASVTLAPADSVSHGQIVKVMDACSTAGIEAVNFALGDDS